MNRKFEYVAFGLLSAVMGAVAGAVVWLALKIMDMGMSILWERIPSELFGRGGSTLAYDVVICVIGGVLIGLWQKRNGVYPESLEEVLAKVKKTGGYQYDRIPVLLVCALLPLFFGGAVGPEAGLTGVIAGLCTLIGDRLKYKGDQVRQLTQAGIGATLSVIFMAPLFGVAENVEERDWGRPYAPAEATAQTAGRPYAPAEGREQILTKKQRIVIYLMAVVGALLAIKGLGALFGGMAGLPRFESAREVSFAQMVGQWKWALPLMLAGILSGVLYAVFNKVTSRIGAKLYDNRVLSCVIAGLILGVAGHYVGSGRFSGEAQMEVLMENWQTVGAGTLILLALVKLLMVNVSVDLGWKGGTIFPMIYSAVATGYGVAALVIGSGGSIEGTYAVAVSAAAMLGFLMRKPVTVVAILLLCFPVTFLPALIVTAFVTSWVGTQAFKRLAAR